MKKILIIFMLVLSLFILSACGKKEALTDKELTSKLTELGFDVNDITDSMEDSNISTVKTANNGVYQIEYYIFKSEDTAKTAYKNNVKLFSSNEKYEGKEENKDNYEKYTQETDLSYNSVVRIDNTLIYVSVNINHKKDVKKVLSKLGY